MAAAFYIMLYCSCRMDNPSPAGGNSSANGFFITATFRGSNWVNLLVNSDFDSATIINTYVILALVLISAAFLTQRSGFKKHFKFSYQHYGVHIAYFALLAGYFHYYNEGIAAIWKAGVFLLSILLYLDSVSNKSFYFLLLFTLYTYFAVSCLVVRAFSDALDTGSFALLMLYFIGSAVGLIFLLIHFNRQIKA